VNYTVRFAPAAAKDLQRLFDFLAKRDAKAARRARTAIAKGIEFLRTFPSVAARRRRNIPIARVDYQFWCKWLRRIVEIEDSSCDRAGCATSREEDFF